MDNGCEGSDRSEDDVDAAKRAARQAALVARRLAHDAAGGNPVTGPLTQILARYPGQIVAGYLPIRTEIDPRPAMALSAERGAVCVPVIDGPGRPLRFARWRPGCRLTSGPFGVAVPEVLEWCVPQVLIVPMLAFDRDGWRLGYGGGFYDRTLAALRDRGPVQAIGFAYAGQEIASIPHGRHDIALDWIATEHEVIPIAGRNAPRDGAAGP